MMNTIVGYLMAFCLHLSALILPHKTDLHANSTFFTGEEKVLEYQEILFTVGEQERKENKQVQIEETQFLDGPYFIL